MKFMLKPILGAIALSLTTQVAIAAETPKKNEGKLSFAIKAMHVVDAKDNGFDPYTGQSELVKVKYVSPKWNNIKFGLGYYLAGDFFSQTDPADGKVAQGMFVTPNQTIDDNMGEAYLDFNNGKVHAYGGRMIFKSPLTTSTTSTMPNFHTAFGVNFKATDSIKLGLTQITQISLGARTMTEFGLIGEKTGTAGTAVSPLALEQAEFHNVSFVTLGPGSQSTNGITALNANFNVSKNLKISVWDYYAEDISNNLYLEASHTTPLNGNKLKISGQYLTQSDVGDKLAGDLDFSMAGVKAALGNKKWNAHIAMNTSSGDTAMLNAWSGDPGYTSTTFSRNEYRENVTAYKVGGKYKITPKWTLSGAYANYGQSDTKVGSLTAQSDATELDVAVAWKPTKKTMLKLIHANRTSEYDTSSNDRTQAHTRLIGMIKF